MQAIEPFRYSREDDFLGGETDPRQQFGDLLTILVNPTLSVLQGECHAAPYTHIHVLTHGDLDIMAKEAYGLVLCGEDGSPDVVSGERFVSAITRVGHHPTVVTIASCDSGNVGSVVIPGASFAHAIHQAGVPFVVGAQFPLSKEGSVPLTGRLYNGLLWGEHPLRVIQEARAELHTRYNTNWHDWASVVVYEALPVTLDDQLEALQYFQAKRANSAALERIDAAVSNPDARWESLTDLTKAATQSLARMPLDGQYCVECLGLRASSQKRLAQAVFTLAGRLTTAESGKWDPYDLLDQARLEYRRAVNGLLVNDAGALQRRATLHWVMVQLVSLTLVLEQTFDQGEWEAGRLCAERYRDHLDIQERAWAYGSLAELWLLRLLRPDLTHDLQEQCRVNAVRYAQKLSGFYPGVDEFPVKSTRRQFERYVDWWGGARFEADLEKRINRQRTPWNSDGGVVDTAKRLVAILHRRQPAIAAPSSPPPAPPSPAAPPPPDEP
ncbi:MAG: CHAT domain-containing protein, partial [Acidobacteriota bacterium]